MKSIVLSFIAMLSFFSIEAQTMEKKKLNVAILLYEGVELFDFAGPGEVFSIARYFSTYTDFNVFTVSGSGETILSQTFLSVNPNYSVVDAPKPDIIILPGGSSRNAHQDMRVINWLKSNFENLDYLLTVCTGVFIAEKAGLLKNHRVTTHWGANYSLSQKQDVEVIAWTKFVDSGKIITSGGVSSGTEGSLHLVQKISGIRTASEVAKYMEYDNWKPNMGIKDYRNPYTQIIPSLELEGHHVLDSSYFGEVEMAGYEFMKAEEWNNARVIFENLTHHFPKEPSNYNNLAKVYTKLGIVSPLSQDDFMKLIQAGSYEQVERAIIEAMGKWPEWIIFDENNVIGMGYNLLAERKYQSAIILFKLIVLAYPQSSNAYDSLAEGYMLIGNREQAVENYNKSLALNPKNTNAKEKLKELGAS